LEGKDSERKRRIKKRRKKAVYSQQAWKSDNHVKVHGWSPCGLPIHAFLKFKPLLMVFERILYFFLFDFFTGII
jgi:hypothetical protein